MARSRRFDPIGNVGALRQAGGSWKQVEVWTDWVRAGAADDKGDSRAFPEPGAGDFGSNRAIVRANDRVEPRTEEYGKLPGH